MKKRSAKNGHKKKPNSSPYKYRIGIKISELMASGYDKTIIHNELQNLLGIGYQQLMLKIRIKVQQSSSITADELLLLSTFFNCSVEDLYNSEAANIQQEEYYKRIKKMRAIPA